MESYHDDEYKKDSITIKSDVVQSVLTKCINEFSIFITRGELEKVFNRSDTKTPKLWKNKFDIIFKNNIEEYRNILVSNKNGIDPNREIGVEMVPVSKLEKLQSVIKKLINEKNQLIIERNQYAQLAQKYKNILENQIISDESSDVVELNSDADELSSDDIFEVDD